MSDMEKLQLEANCSELSGSFLNALPFNANFTFSDEFMSYFLNLRLIFNNFYHQCPRCGYTNLGLDHSFQCKGVSRCIKNRHDEVRDYLLNISKYEKEKEFEIGLKKFYLDLFDPKTKIAFDITIVGGFGNKWQDAYSQAFATKIRKYSILKEYNLISEIVPLVFNVHGGWYKKTKETFKRFGWIELCSEISCIIQKNSFRCNQAFNSILQRIHEARRFW
ncbi:hypothetical protein P9112_000458 [Eukaryota sp. TZLM1-RC]